MTFAAEFSGARANVVGAGPNGLTAAAILARQGWEVRVYEASDHPGGAAASLSAFIDCTVDFGAAAHPFAQVSPAFAELGLEGNGLRWRFSQYPLAHPLPGAPAAMLHPNLQDTAAGLGADAEAWRRVYGPIVRDIDSHVANLLGPVLRSPQHPLRLLQFGGRAALSARDLTRLAFRGEQAKALFLGSAAHAIAPSSAAFSSAFGVLFNALGMSHGWPVAEGGSGSIVAALVRIIEAHGGTLHYGRRVRDLHDLPRADANILNLTAHGVLALGGLNLPRRARTRLAAWRYGTAVFKVDYLLDGAIPWADPEVANATTVHVCGTAAEVELAEWLAAQGTLPERPFVMLCQQQIADSTRAPDGKHVVWAYAHVPHGYAEPRPGLVAARIEEQIERFAPSFRERIVDKVETSPRAFELQNPNLVGGDIAGGAMDGLQTLFRPRATLNPYRLAPGLYMASSSAAPGAGVHGMAGYGAARAALRDMQREA